jgi:hypothetical protein
MVRAVPIRVLRQKDCTSFIRNARRRLDDNQRYKTDHLSYQRQLSALDDGDKGTGVLCYYCRRLIKIGNKYVKIHGRKGGGPYHPLCAKKLHIT